MEAEGKVSRRAKLVIGFILMLIVLAGVAAFAVPRFTSRKLTEGLAREEIVCMEIYGYRPYSSGVRYRTEDPELISQCYDLLDQCVGKPVGSHVRDPIETLAFVFTTRSGKQRFYGRGLKEDQIIDGTVCRVRPEDVDALKKLWEIITPIWEENKWKSLIEPYIAR